MIGGRYLIHKNRLTLKKTYRALVGGRPLHRTQPTATGAVEYQQRVEARWAALRAVGNSGSDEFTDQGEHASSG